MTLPHEVGFRRLATVGDNSNSDSSRAGLRLRFSLRSESAVDGVFERTGVVGGKSTFFGRRLFFSFLAELSIISLKETKVCQTRFGE